MKNKFVIIATVLALVLMPCAKISAVYAKSVAQAGATTGEPSDAGINTPAETGIVVAASSLEQGADPRCTKRCTQWHGVLPRFDAKATQVHAGKLVMVVWPYLEARSQSATILAGLRARSPPRLAGTAFQNFFARTSRFLS